MEFKFKRAVVFTDGASRGNPGPGGFGAIIIAPKNNEVGSMNYEVTEIGGREGDTTNNRMELTAAIKALQGITNHQSSITKIILYTDSSYLINGITKWIYGWQKNGWKTKEKKDVENRDLWESLAELKELLGTKNPMEIEWKHVGGHIGVAGNERADEIASNFADGKKEVLYSGNLENYPVKNILNITSDRTAKESKSQNRARSKAKAYSYVSKVHGVIQTHKTWAECESRVKGRPAKFKKALNEKEEKEIINSWTNL
ncbi:MAG: ribonuclease H [bacterium]|nr:ribonuclease H [bacterium]